MTILKCRTTRFIKRSLFSIATAKPLGTDSIETEKKFRGKHCKIFDILVERSSESQTVIVTAK